jgi:cytochrome c oxidase assembly protein subunit 11
MALFPCTRWYILLYSPLLYLQALTFSFLQICQTTGWGGQPIRAHGGPEGDLSSRLRPVTDAPRIRVTFASSVSDVLPWKFVPQQKEVRVLPGETALAFYTATNTSDQDIIGVATYSVTPAQVAPYFSKIQCFCFEEQRLSAGETVDMPVFFYLDPDLLKDINMKGVQTVTLNYTFFSESSLHFCSKEKIFLTFFALQKRGTTTMGGLSRRYRHHKCVWGGGFDVKISWHVF